MKKIEIDEIKKIEENILNSFDNFCNKNDLRYFLYAGTLIGAVRHKGFIPWDDDIDVSMPRPDYEKFKMLTMNTNINEIYEMICFENGKTDYNFIKLIDNRTIAYEKFSDKKYKMGVYIDIFPIDGLPDSYLKCRLLCTRLNFLRRILSFKMARFGKGKTIFRSVLKSIIIPFAKLVPQKFLMKRINNIFSKYNYDSSKYVGMVSHSYSYKARIERNAYSNIKLLFEKKYYNAPSGYDKLLKQLYGNYMELPPKEKQIRHAYDAYWK